MTETQFANARLVLPGEVILGSLAVKHGLICDISTGSGVPKGALDCEGDLLIPGVPGVLDAWPVGKDVGNVRNNGAALIEPA